MKEHLEKACAQLLTLAPLWGVLVARLEKHADDRLPVPISTDGKRILFNPALLRQFRAAERVYLLAKIVMHIIYGHHWRRKGRDPEAWQSAAAYCVNDFLARRYGSRVHPIRIPDGILLDPHFRGWSVERIYAALMDQAQPSAKATAAPPEMFNPQNPAGPGGSDTAPKPGEGEEGQTPDDQADQGGAGNPSGAEEDSHEDQADEHEGTPGAGSGPQPRESVNQLPHHPAVRFGTVSDAEKPDQAEAENRAQLESAAQSAEMVGIGEHQDGAISRALEARRIAYDWERHLAGMLYDVTTTAGADDYAWSRRNPYCEEVYLPAMVSTTPPPLDVAIDTSGSVSADQLAEMVAGIRAMASNYEDLEITVYCCDAAIRSKKTVRGDQFAVDLKGGGGTKFEPVFDDNPQRHMLIYFTDLIATFPPPPTYPVLWVYTGPWENPPRVPPYGKIVRLRS